MGSSFATVRAYFAWASTLALLACGASDKPGASSVAGKGDADVGTLHFDASLPGDGLGDGSGPGPDGEVLDAADDLALPKYDAVANCPGGPLCPCAANTDCQSGLCLEDPSVSSGKACAQACKPSCPNGYTCANLTSGGADIQQMCVFKAARLCNPCAADSDCAVVGLVDSKCVDQGPLGRFCGVACGSDAECPQDYTCQNVPAVGGGKFQQCVRKADGVQTPYGVCPCSPAAVAQELQTTCALLSKAADGTVAAQCPGVRKCSDKGLSVCLGAAPTAEVCDGGDNDCDGTTDEGGCDDANPCTTDNCQGGKGCVYQPLSGSACDADSSGCTVSDQCIAGVCAKGAPLDCSDGNPCTVDTCEPGAGCLHKATEGLPCTDDNPCTLGDVCNSGSCKAGVPKTCNAPDGCHTAQCELASGNCKYGDAPESTPCDDGLVCTADDACKAGNCVGKPKTCNDGNPCTQDSCNPKSGCSFGVQGEIACDDGNACTAGDLCMVGKCVGLAVDVSASFAAKGCNDGEPCTIDSCAPAVGCSSKPLDGTACDDGEPCTAKDECQKGKCVSSNYQCQCKVDADCAAKEDGNLCNGTLVCAKNGPLPVCVLAPDSVVKCDTSGDSACLATTCVVATGKCVANAAAEGAPCSDGDACTAGDGCKAGQCGAGKKVDCDDGNPCTADSCDKGKGCVQVGLTGAACDADGSVCTQEDACLAGTCVKGKGVVCDDGNPCTVDGCEPAKGCGAVPAANKTPCDDGDKCTGPDSCMDGECSGINTCKVMTFAAPTAHTAYSAPGVCGIAIGDITGDSLADIVFEAPTGLGYFANSAGGVLPSQATGKFGDATPSCGLHLADFNKDGQLDVVTALPNAATVRVLLIKVTKGTPSVMATIATSTFPKCAVREVADFDGDGHLDLVLGADGTQWQIWRNNKGTNEFVQATTVLNGNVTDVSALALDLDGVPPVDLALVANHMFQATAAVIALVNKSSPGSIGPLTGVTTTLTPTGFTCASAGNFNGDSHADIVAGGNGVQLWLGKGLGSFAVGSTLGLKGVQVVRAGDFDQDSAGDFALAGFGPAINAYKGSGNGKFLAPISIALPVTVRLLRVADLNGDGLQDLVAADPADGRVFVAKNSSK